MIRMFTIFTMLAIAALPSSAQDVLFYTNQGVGAGMAFPAPAPEESVTAAKNALNLSEAQVTGLRALLTQRAEAANTAFQEMGEKQRALHTSLSQQSPNALDIGNAYLAMQSAQNRLKSVEQKFQTDFRALLTPEQRVILQNLQNASGQIDALRMLGIVAGEPRPFEFALPAMGPLPLIGPPGGGVAGAERSIRIFRRNEPTPC